MFLDLNKTLEATIYVIGGGVGSKLIQLLINKFRKRQQESVAFKKLDIDYDEKFRVELWERIKNLEAKVTDLERKEQDCWDKYNLLFKKNSEIEAELNFVKSILKASGTELTRLLPTTPKDKSK